MKDEKDRKTADLLSKKAGRPTKYSTVEEAQDAHREQKAEYARKQREMKKQLESNEALRVNAYLQVMQLSAIQEINDAELSKFISILDHWLKMSISEQQSRKTIR